MIPLQEGRVCRVPLAADSQRKLRDVLLKSAARLAVVNPGILDCLKVDLIFLGVSILGVH